MAPLIAQEGIGIWVTGILQVVVMLVVGILGVRVSLVLATRSEKKRVKDAKRTAWARWRRKVVEVERRLCEIEDFNRECPYCPPHRRTKEQDVGDDGDA